MDTHIIVDLEIRSGQEGGRRLPMKAVPETDYLYTTQIDTGKNISACSLILKEIGTMQPGSSYKDVPVFLYFLEDLKNEIKIHDPIKIREGGKIIAVGKIKKVLF